MAELNFSSDGDGGNRSIFLAESFVVTLEEFTLVDSNVLGCSAGCIPRLERRRRLLFNWFSNSLRIWIYRSRDWARLVQVVYDDEPKHFSIAPPRCSCGRKSARGSTIGNDR